MAKRRREIQLKFCVTPEEQALIHQKMEQYGTENMSSYLRKTATDGYVGASGFTGAAGAGVPAVPVVLALALFIWICFRLLSCAAFLFGLDGAVVGLLGLAVLLTYSVQDGIILLMIAFLVSPVGLPMGAAWLLGKLQDLRYAIQDRVYG